MPDVDSNGVDILDRFLAYKCRFMQFSVTEDVFNQVIEYIKELRNERDEARREICVMLEDATNNHRENHAKRWGWDCYKEDDK
jgi:hypothetical protein